MSDKLEFNIYSDTFRGTRVICDILIHLLEERKEKIHVIKRADLFVLEMENYKFNFLPLNNKKIFEIIEKRDLDSFNEVLKLENAIKEHRAQKLDDRCWLDDQKLYAVLNDGNLGDNTTPPMEKMLANCKNYLEKRCHPDSQWKSYQELEEENKKLREEAEQRYNS